MSVAIEVVYRGVFQKTLAGRICRGLVMAGRREGRTGTAFSRYGDSPERNGIPAKQFAVIAQDNEELQADLAKYEPSEVGLSIVLDDTLCKGIESWAWYGFQPINKALKPGGVLLVVSDKSPEELLRHVAKRPFEYTLAVLRGQASLAGLWVYKDDDTDRRVMGAVARVAPVAARLESLLVTVRDSTGDDARVAATRAGYDEVVIKKVAPGEGAELPAVGFTKPGWRQMREGIVVDGMIPDVRNPYYKKAATRTLRPVVHYDKCIKCTLCWLDCPDSSFDVTPDGYYDPNYESCCGCGICADVCPVKGCIEMVDELRFADNSSFYPRWLHDRAGYELWLREEVGVLAGGVS